MANSASVLVTGASGFLGRKVAADLSRDRQVISLGRTVVGSSNGIEHIDADLSQAVDHRRLPKAIDSVVHLAQSRRYRDGIDGVADVVAVNVTSTATLLRWAAEAGAKSFVYASTGSVYGAGSDPASEHDVLNVAGDLYAATKAAGEAIVSGFARSFAAISLRLYALYGPNQTGRMISGIVESVAAGRAVILNGPDGVMTQPTFVDDAVAAIRLAIAGRWSGAVNVAGPQAVSIRAIANLASSKLARAARFETAPSAPASVRLPSLDRLRGLMPQHRFESIESGIAKTVTAFLNKQDD